MLIVNLQQRPEFFAIVADRIWTAWWQRHGVPRDHIAARLRENMIARTLPLALVAHDGPTFLGTASVIASDLDDRPHYTPWVAAVWVEPDRRGSGIGAALVAAAAEAAFGSGAAQVYLAARPALRTWYEGLGWGVVEEGVGPLELSVFRRLRDV
ncbi:GNAT family N-acetyltransferase [Bradyrhizobium sp. 2TAF24]|uniref:GNAT family N-acetyltransferase n=1 Tax=Bradyrhizobium sp. 2TAF24 TaxID=3233011 RepID=UPI003F915023